MRYLAYNVRFSVVPIDSSCLLLIGAEYFVFQTAIKQFKDLDIQNYNFARFVWVWHLITNIEGGTQAEGIWE